MKILTFFSFLASGSYNITTPADGIALSVDVSTLYYCPLSGFNLYSIPTELFRNFSVSDSEVIFSYFFVYYLLTCTFFL